MTSSRHARRGTVLALVVTLVAVFFVPLVAAGASAAGAPFSTRMTGRWTPHVDERGVRWDARSGSLGTVRSSLQLATSHIIGTDMPSLYQVSAIDVRGYQVAVPRAGDYRVRLLMAEGWWNAPGKRVFDVHAEGELAAEKVDIFAAVGRGTAHEVSFVVGVDDGRLDLRFVARADLPLVSAIEVVEVPPTPSVGPQPGPTAPVGPPAPSPSATGVSDPTGPAPTPTPEPAPEPTPEPTPEHPATAVKETFAYRMTASREPITDSHGHTWKRMGPGLGSSRVDSQLVGRDVSGTEDDELYRRSVVGSKGVLVPVPAAATYTVRLLMAEGYWQEPGARVVDVHAEGRVVAAGVDLVAAAGHGAAHDIRFDVDVDDQMLTIRLVSQAGDPLLAGIEVTSTDPAAASGLPGASLIPLSRSSVFHLDVRDAPVAANSAAAMARLRAAIDNGQGWNAGVNAYRYNSSHYTVTPETPRHTVGFHDCQAKGYTPNGLFDGPQYFVDVPIPENAIPATGGDAQMGIYDPTTDRIWEFWQMRRTSAGGWEACWGGRVDDLTTSDGTFPEPFGVTASGLVMAGGMISVQEAARGEIDHALYLGVTEAQALLYSFPANRTDGQSQGEDLLVEGQRLRLDPSLDVTRLGLTPFGEAVARAAQRYGFIVSDLAGHVILATESGRTKEARSGLNPWDVLLGGPDWAALQNFPWNRVEVIPVDHGKPE